MFYASVSLYLIPKQFFLPKVSAYIFFVGIEVAVCSYMYIGTYGAGGYITYYYLINSCGGLTLMKSRASILRRVTEESRKDFLKKMMDDRWDDRHFFYFFYYAHLCSEWVPFLFVCMLFLYLDLLLLLVYYLLLIIK